MIIQLSNINKIYGNNATALKDINVTFQEKETVAIIGSSGSGKTTLLRLISNLETASSGKIIIEDKELNKKNSNFLQLKIGLIFQNFNLFPHMQVIDNLVYSPINILKINKAEAIKKAENLLSQFKLESKILAYPNSLSGGQKQRVAICRALMMEPKIILCDEPTSALDPDAIQEVTQAILLLKKQTSLIIVSHNLNFAKEVADRIIFLDHGQIIADQKTEDFFTKPKSHRARLFLEKSCEII